MNKYTKRQKSFVIAYTDHGTLTHGNAKQSAIKAGYCKKNAHNTGCLLLQLPHILKAIQTRESDWLNECNKSKEDKIALAWDNFLKAKQNRNIRDAQFWFKEHGLLRGDYVERKEVKQDIYYSENESNELQSLRSRLHSSVN